jgi:hypothetical protein
MVMGAGLPIHLEDDLAEELKKVIADIPEDRRGQLSLVVGMKGVSVVAGAKVGSHIEVAAEAGKPWDGKPQAGAAIRVSWAP